MTLNKSISITRQPTLSETPSYTVSQKNDIKVAQYNFDGDQPILIIFGRDVADRVRYQTVICYPTSPN